MVFSHSILNGITTAVKDIFGRGRPDSERRNTVLTTVIFVLIQKQEQSHEWNSTLYAVFVDFERAFDSLHCESRWNILRHYGIPQ